MKRTNTYDPDPQNAPYIKDFFGAEIYQHGEYYEHDVNKIREENVKDYLHKQIDELSLTRLAEIWEMRKRVYE
jgi:hypothetical protein